MEMNATVFILGTLSSSTHCIASQVTYLVDWLRYLWISCGSMVPKTPLGRLQRCYPKPLKSWVVKEHIPWYYHTLQQMTWRHLKCINWEKSSYSYSTHWWVPTDTSSSDGNYIKTKKRLIYDFLRSPAISNRHLCLEPNERILTLLLTADLFTILFVLWYILYMC